MQQADGLEESLAVGAGAGLAVDRSARPTHRSYLHDEVFRQIARLIERQEYPRGARLPTEVELAHRFGVSRPIVRRALERLRSSGYVATRKGSGTVVVHGPEAHAPLFAPLSSIADLQQFYEYRIGLEGHTAAIAAQRRSEADLVAIAGTLERCELALREGDSGIAADINFAFHRAVAAASANRFSIATLEFLPNLVGVTPLKRALGPPSLDHARDRRVFSEHAAIFQAIRDRDSERARSMMIDHIASAMRFVFERTPVGGEGVSFPRD